MNRKTKKTGKKSIKDELSKIFKMSPPLIWALVIIVLFSTALLFIAREYKLETLHEIGVLGVTITPILFIYERALRVHLLNEMTSALKDIINEAAIKEDILQFLKKSQSDVFNNLIESGMSDAFIRLDPSHLEKRLLANKGEIKVSKIWMPYVNQNLDINVFVTSIENGCNYKFVLWDPEMDEALIRRARASKSYDLTKYKRHIVDNIDFLQTLWVELKKKGKEDKLELRLHNDFIAASLIGFDEYFLLGLYLNGRIATNGMQLKIDRDTKNGSAFYKELNNHFNIQWKDAYKQVVFNENGYEVVDRVNS